MGAGLVVVPSMLHPVGYVTGTTLSTNAENTRKQTMIENTYKPLAELKALYRDTEQERRKRAYDDKKLARKLNRMTKVKK
jgi:hypothetical protein